MIRLGIYPDRDGQDEHYQLTMMLPAASQREPQALINHACAGSAA